MKILETKNRFIIKPFLNKNTVSSENDHDYILIDKKNKTIEIDIAEPVSLKKLKKINNGIQIAIKFLKDLNKNESI